MFRNENKYLEVMCKNIVFYRIALFVSLRVYYVSL